MAQFTALHAVYYYTLFPNIRIVLMTSCDFTIILPHNHFKIVDDDYIL